MASEIVIPARGDIGAYSDTINTAMVTEKGNFDGRVADALWDGLTVAKSEITALQAADTATLASLAATTTGNGASLVGIEDAATIYTAANVEAALAEVKVIADAGMTAQKKTVTVGHADLTDADTSQTINISTALPNNARIVGVDMRSFTAFSGGSVSALTVDVGTSGDIDALIDGADLFTAAVDGGPATMPRGVRPNKMFASGGQLIATFVSVDDNLVNLTAGSVVIDVLYVVLA